MRKIIFIFFFLNLTFNLINGQDVQFSSVGIGVTPIPPSTPSEGTTLNLKTGWGDYIQFRKTQDNGRWAIHNPEFGNRLEFFYKNPDGSSIYKVLNLENNGKVYIGSIVNLPGNYKLYVEQGILTEKVKVAIKTSADWSDYVFDKKYALMPIPQLEYFIKKHKHLPGIPSANEMVKRGNDLGETDALLLAKIEELALYIIQLKKENEVLSQRIKSLEVKSNNK